jgi:hypothetical protein
MNDATDDKQPKPTKVVDFLLLKSLRDPSPTVVKREHRICLLLYWRRSRFKF